MHLGKQIATVLIVLSMCSTAAFSQTYYSTSQALESYNNGIKIERQAEASGTTNGLEDAARSYQRAIEADPDMVQAYIRLGYVLYALNRSDEGIQVLEKGLLRHTNNLELQHYLGLNLYQAGRTDDAENILIKVTSESQEQLPEAYFVLGKINLERGDTEKAAEYFEKYTIASPSDKRSWQALSSAYIQQKDIDRAEQALNKLMELSPEDPIALLNMGHIQYEKHQADEAVKYYERALKADSSRDDLLYTIASVYYLDGQYEEAIERFKKVLDKRKSHMSAQYFIADSELKLNRLNDAEEHFAALLSKMPEYHYLKLKLAYIRILKGQRSALTEFRKLIKESTNPDEFHFGAVVLRRTGDRKNAVAIHQKLKSEHEDDPIYDIYLARDYLEIGQYQDAIDLLTKVVGKNKDPLAIELLSIILLNLGAENMNSGELKEAKNKFEQARSLNVHPQEAICNLAQILILENKKDDAYRLFQQAEQISTQTPVVIKMAAQFDIFDHQYEAAIERLKPLTTGKDVVQDGTAWYLMAIAQSNLGQWSEAAKSLSKSEKLGVSDSPAKAMIQIQGILKAYQDNDNSRADKLISKLTDYRDKMRPQDRVRYDYLTAISYLKNRKFSQAKTALENTKNGFDKLEPEQKNEVTANGELDLSYELAYVQYELNNYDAALAILTEMNTPDGRTLESAVRRKLAVQALKNHKYDLAQEHYNKLTEIGTSGNIDQYNLFLTQLQMNKMPNPAEKFEKFIKQNIPESILNYAIYLDNSGDSEQAMKYYREYVSRKNGEHVQEVQQMLTTKARVWGP